MAVTREQVLAYRVGVQQLAVERMFGRQDHARGAENGIYARGEDADRLARAAGIRVAPAEALAPEVGRLRRPATSRATRTG